MIHVVVSGIPRGHQFPRPDGNWLTEEQRQQILSISPVIELLELPEQVVHKMERVDNVEVALAEGGNYTHYVGELDRTDYEKFFTPSLRWIQLCSTGFSDNITSEILDGRVTLTNSPGIHTISIAESVLAAVLEQAKRFGQRRIDQRDKRWRQVLCEDLDEQTILLIGLGNLGKRVARLCKAFDMRVIGTKVRIEPVPNVDEVFSSSDLIDRLPEADYVVELAPLTSETVALIGEAAFRAMKKSCYFINVGRGRVADEEAMTRALREGWISGAYLDCFGVEPLPPDSPLWGLGNVFIVPHDSHSSPKIGNRIVTQFCENLRRYVVGEPLLNVCDPHRGY
ncbi:MAG: D-2-hydroxyacid dehydrogenase [Candidatus Bathyarchaeia archaeon]|jgi:phosphoglycerate dehydrogenase-like enzyme